MAVEAKSETDSKTGEHGQLTEVPEPRKPLFEGDFAFLEDSVSSIYSAIGWGMEGTGKSLFFLKYFPLPIMVQNLDRPLTPAHLGALKRERYDRIAVTNLRPGQEDLSQAEATHITNMLERNIIKNLKALKGGTVMIDGGTLWRDSLALADPTMGPKLASGQRINPKDKAQVNAYMAAFMSYIQDQGINLALTCHAANSWEMVKTLNEDGTSKNQLMRTKQVYPKFHEVAFERANLSLLMFKRCECGRNITHQDGTCVAQNDPTEDRPKVTEGHQGRKHMTRIVTNKFWTQCEGTEWEDLNGDTLKMLCFDAKKAAALLA